MAVEVLLSRAAQKDIANLPLVVQVRVQDAILRLASYPDITGVKALKGALRGKFRVRVGSYRIVFVVQANAVTVVSVDDRKDAY
ncbi:MAG: type II toxin-antitoxin system RelE/ParE family toxin [Polyangiaceae bacterium]|nr:type II toxin-antitoxin system RelE/ParE family toxin [Polyangiaceae bacterium]